MNDHTQTRILLVDDDAAIANLLRTLLTGLGYQLTVARTGEEALTQAQRQPPDLVLLDVLLPGMDGYTLCRKLRQHPATCNVPILMLTARAETADKLAGFNAGADDYLTKPFEPQELVYRVRALLARAHPSPPFAEQGYRHESRQGRIVAVFGAKGGVGKTTIAVNLAIALARDGKTQVALMDGDFFFGDVGVHLNLSPSRSIVDLLEHVDDLDEIVLNRVLIRHESGVRVLLAPYHPEQAEQIGEEHVRKILRALAAAFDCLVVDCQASYDDLTLTILEQADQIMLVLTPEIGPVKNTSVFFDLAAKIGIEQSRIQLVLNRADSEVGIAPSEIERALQKPVVLRLKSGGRAVVLSVNRGLPIVMHQPQHPFSQQILRVAEVVRMPVHA